MNDLPRFVAFPQVFMSLLSFYEEVRILYTPDLSSISGYREILYKIIFQFTVDIWLCIFYANVPFRYRLGDSFELYLFLGSFATDLSFQYQKYRNNSKCLQTAHHL
ncbi:hypothetical protein TNCT_739371 [Trichonephila clavata]|uniref:Uncharacterized protein n=1 Tax=Trichonephila clavata TaxID=2740835 RepID=A0A8X6HJ66_TRICU|nr:hypothetical protein TNCT_739371 [Trichonephila clavata]